MTSRALPIVFPLALFTSLAVLGAQTTPIVTITINRAVKHQTIRGWGGTLSLSRNLNHMDQAVIDQLIDDLVTNLGLTFLRIEDGILDEPFNDNADPNAIDWNRFHDGTTIDRDVQRGLRRFISQVQARGVQPTLMLVKNWRGAIPWWMTDAEIAEHLFANALYYKQRHAIDINFISVTNDADRALLAPARYPAIARAFDDKARAAGLSSRLTFDEGRNAEATWSAVSQLQNDTSFWSRVGLLSWHGPGSTDGFRNQLRDFGASRQIPTAMSGFSGATIEDLFNDLTQANVSYWARNWILESGPAAADGETTYFSTGFDGVSFRHNQAYFRFQPIMNYVPVGAVRVEATSSNPAVRVAVFEKDNLCYLVVLNTSSQVVRTGIQGANSFGFTRMVNASSTPTGTFMPLVPFNVQTGGPQQVAPGEVGFAVPYAPTTPIAGRWDATPGSVTLPTPSVRLTGRGVGMARAGDFGDPIPVVVDWSQISGPTAVSGIGLVAGGIANATNLAAGTYEFEVHIFHGLRFMEFAHTSRRLRVRVFDSNQAPVITEGYRYYRDEWIIAPQPTQTYGADFISAGDVEGDPLTTSFSVVSQPSGANATFNGTTVTGMTRTGDYVFRFTARDATHTVTRDFTRRVVADEALPPGGGRRRPESAPVKGVAAPRGTSSGSSSSPAAVATDSRATARPTGAVSRPQRPSVLTVFRVRELVRALETGEPTGLPAWRHLDLLDVDDDGDVDVIRIELIDGTAWTVAYPPVVGHLSPMSPVR